VRYRGDHSHYRFTVEGFVCRGYSFRGPRRRIFLTCFRETAVVDLVRN
jgi:hypothetical protein